MSAVRVLLVDDHTLFRSGLRSLLAGVPTVSVVGEAATSEEAVEMAVELRPDIVLMDVRMPLSGGIKATEEITRRTDLRVLILSFSEQNEDLLNCIRAGARGYILKNAEADDLTGAIHAVADGFGYLSPAVTLRLFDLVSQAAFAPASRPLTSREVDVLKLLERGASNKEVAKQLTISENTVKTHVRNVLEKMSLRSRQELLSYSTTPSTVPGD